MATSKRIYKGLDAAADSLYGWVKRKRVSVSDWMQLAEQAEQDSRSLMALSDEALQQHVHSSRARCRRQSKLSETDLVATFALVAELCWRSLGKRPYVVQLCSALLMYRGHAVQMATGEGKTLTASLCAVVRAWHGKPVHVMTSNDYLARRDAESLMPLYQQSGLSVGFLQDAMSPEERRHHYRCDVTYATSSNVLADYLKDRLKQDQEPGSNAEKIGQLTDPNLPDKRLVPALETAVVDEADSVLADDAITPLIISARQPDEGLHEATLAALAVLPFMVEEADFKVYPRARTVVLTDEGVERLEQWQDSFPALWKVRHKMAHVMTQVLTAHHVFQRDRDYVVSDGLIVLVDAKTGRLMPSRSLSHGLQQAIEAKEQLVLTDPASVSARMSFQAFFRLYRNLSGMSGTLQYIESELWRVYRLPCVNIPGRLPRQHQSLGEVLLSDGTSKYLAIADHLVGFQAQQAIPRPVLVGTGSILESRELSGLLHQAGIAHQILNALNDDEEADIVARAGQPGKVTVATNMAGRGTDILLGDGVEAAGGLHVVATERGPSRRVDLQMFGRASRQGQAGSSISFLSLDDDLPFKKLPAKLRQFLVRHWNKPLIPVLALVVYRLLQWQADASGSRLRIKILLEDIRFQQVMSFTRKIG